MFTLEHERNWVPCLHHIKCIHHVNKLWISNSSSCNLHSFLPYLWSLWNPFARYIYPLIKMLTTLIGWTFSKFHDITLYMKLHICVCVYTLTFFVLQYSESFMICELLSYSSFFLATSSSGIFGSVATKDKLESNFILSFTKDQKKKRKKERNSKHQRLAISVSNIKWFSLFKIYYLYINNFSLRKVILTSEELNWEKYDLSGQN